VKDEAAEDEAAAVKAGEVLRDVEEVEAVVGSEERKVWATRWVRCEVLHGAVGGGDPAVFVFAVLGTVVDVHLGERGQLL
jgi:hypothetical protein